LRLLASRTVTEQEDGDDDRQLHEDEDAGGDPEHRPEEGVDLAGEGALGIERVEGSVLHVWRDQLTRRQCERQEDQTCEPERSESRSHRAASYGAFSPAPTRSNAPRGAAAGRAG